jgi:uncharacterized protein YjbI with pentapeptide repeats
VRVAGFTATQLVPFNYTSLQLKTAGYTSKNLYDASYTSISLFNAGYNAKDIYDAGYTASQARDAGYMAFQTFQAGYTLAQLAAGGYTPQQLQSANFTAIQLKGVGFSATDLYGLYVATQLYDASYSAVDMKAAGYGAGDLYTAGYSITSIKDAQYTISQIRAGGIPIAVVHNGSFTGAQLKSAGYSAIELKSVNFTLPQLHDLSYSSIETKAAGYSVSQLYSAGYNTAELKAADYSITDMKSIGITDDLLLAAGFTKEEILAAGIQFNLDYFSSAAVMGTSASTWEGLIPEDLHDFSANAVFYMSQEDIQKVFAIKLTGDLQDLSHNDITYFINMHNWPSTVKLNPSNAMLDQPASSGALLSVGIQNKMLVKHDFIRYLALRLFNTAQGVDLFNNEASLVSALDSMGSTSYHTDISSVLWGLSSINPNPTLTSTYIYDPSLNLYGTTDDMKTNDNICRELCQQILFENNDRFALLYKNAQGLYPIPILTGDTISFTYTIYPAPNQHLLTSVQPIPPRTYRISIIIDDGTGRNTVSTD